MLTKQLITSGAYLEHYGDVPNDILWSVERIERSMQDVMNARPDSGDFWVFAYGSLIWNPLLSFLEKQRATLQGWQRSFCLRLIAGRATVEQPGRMLALEPGGHTQGVAYKLSGQAAQDELSLLWVREMSLGAYRPIWTTVSLEDGSNATALVFIAEPDHPLFESDASVGSIANSIAKAEGPMGTNADYVHRLFRALRKLGVVDEYINALSAEIMY